MPTFKTQKELLTEQRKQLDNRFLQKYPNGKFCLQHRNDGLALYYGPAFFGLHWCPTRSTGAYKCRGITTYCHTWHRPGVSHENHQNNCFGNCSNYDSLEKLTAACGKKKVPHELVVAFLERYNNRGSENPQWA